MIDGFLGTRASFMLDFVFLAMFGVIPIMGWSIYQVKFNRRYQLHKTVQLILGVVLLVAVTLFEVDMRLYGWTDRAAPGSGKPSAAVWTTLYIHLFFAITTAALWIFVIVQALRKIPKPPGPCEYSSRHLFWGKLAAVDMFMTALTGWVFYLLAFAF
jgi:putative membrane protein